MLLQQHHYLGYRGPVGENLKYLVYDRQERVLGCLFYGAAAWRVASRDRFIGWNEAARKCGLSRIANNMRFLILPDIRVPHLASHLLAMISKVNDAGWWCLSVTGRNRGLAARPTSSCSFRRPRQ